MKKSVIALGLVGLSASVNVGQLVSDGLQTVGDATQKNKNIGNLVNDGINIIGDLTSNNEEMFHLGHVLHTVGEVAQVAGAVGEITAFSVGKILDDADSVGKIVEAGAEIMGDSFVAKKTTTTKTATKPVAKPAAKKPVAKKPVAKPVAAKPVTISIPNIPAPTDNSEEMFHIHLGKVLGDVTKVAEVAGTVASVAAINVGNLVNEGIQTAGDIKSKNIGGLINDGINIVGDLTGNSEEMFHLHIGKVLDDASKVAEVAGTVASVAAINVGNLVNEGIQTAGDIKSKNIGGLINDGINIVGDLTGNSEEMFHIHLGKVLGDVTKVAEVAGTVASVAAINVGQLVNDGIQTVGDATQKNKNIGNLVNDGINIIGDLTSNNSEEMFHIHLGKVLGDVTKVAEVAGTVASVAAINVGNLVNQGIQTASDIKSKNIGGLINDGINIVGDLTGNSEEMFHLGHILHTVGEVAQVAGAVSEVAAFHLGHVLHDVTKVAEVAGTVSEVAALNVGNLVNQGIQTASDIKSKNIGGLINDGINIVGDLTGNSEEMFHLHIGKVLGDATKVAEVAGDVAEVAGFQQKGFLAI